MSCWRFLACQVKNTQGRTPIPPNSTDKNASFSHVGRLNENASRERKPPKAKRAQRPIRQMRTLGCWSRAALRRASDKSKSPVASSFVEKAWGCPSNGGLGSVDVASVDSRLPTFG